MKSLLKNVCILLLIAMFISMFTSCKKDSDLSDLTTTQEPTTTNTTSPNNNPTTTLLALGQTGQMKNDSMDLCDCFDLFDSVDWNASDAAIEVALTAVLATLTETQIEELFTPVCTADGAVYINACVADCNGVTDYEACDDDDFCADEFELCFDFVYPLTIVLPDASTATVNNEDALWMAVENWYLANPNNDEDSTLQYPVNVLLEDGSTATINNDDELDDLIEGCFEFEIDECFSLVYPIEVQFPGGTTAITNSDDELMTTIDNWYDANPNSMEDPTLVFPIQVELEDGTIQIVETEDELDNLFEDCYGNMGGCFITGDSDNALAKGVAQKNISKRN